MKFLKNLPASISEESKDITANYHLTKINFFRQQETKIGNLYVVNTIEVVRYWKLNS